MNSSDPTANFCFCTLALRKKYQQLTKTLAEDLQKYAPQSKIVVGTDAPQYFDNVPNVIAFKHNQKSILHCYNDKRFVLAESLKLFPTAIFIDADTRLIESLPDSLDFTLGIVGCNQSLVEHNKKYRPRDFPNLIKVSEKLGISSEGVKWIGESLFIVTRDEGKEQEFLEWWGKIALYLEMKGMHSGEGSIMGLAAAKVGWTVDTSEAWLILKNKTNHLDASYQSPVKKDFWQPIQKRLGYHYRLNLARLNSLKKYDFYYL
jgi:hypothetical protein